MAACRTFGELTQMSICFGNGQKARKRDILDIVVVVVVDDEIFSLSVVL